ncbi:MAG TPA: helix-turn-helix domain-containing protein [Limnochorda sp.]
MTPRQEQFLRALAEICRHREAAHYSDVARRLHVSKWTAYDMMQRLEAAGYVERLYEVDPSAGGRSRILFRPVQAAALKTGDSRTPPSEWQDLRPWLVEQVRRARERGNLSALQELQEALRSTLSPAAYCAVFTTCLLVTLRSVVDSLEGAWLVQTFLPAGASPVGLLLFAGAALATLHRSSHGLFAPMASHADRYRQTLAKLDDSHQAALSALAHDLARHLWGEAGATA